MITAGDDLALLNSLHVFQIHGRDKRGRTLLRVVAKSFPARLVTVDLLKRYLDENIFPKLENKPFAVVFIHTGVERSENFPGISALRSIYEAIPVSVKQNLEAVYFVHPGIQSRLFLAAFGRFLFTGGVYAKLKYINRLDYLWEHVRRGEIDVPDFVYDHDEDLEHRPMMDYGLESDHARVYGAPAVDSSESMYSMRSGGFNYDAKFRGATAKSLSSLQDEKSLSENGSVCNHARVLVGSGLETYEKGKMALKDWRHFGLNWAFVDPKTPIQNGLKFCVCVKEFVPWVMMPLQIVYVDENRSRK